MTSEYVHISANEKIYSKKSLLQSQLELISLIKHLENYKNFRSQEILLKISLKNKIEELQSLILLLEKLLPKTSLSKKEITPQPKETTKAKKRRASLEEEVEEIRKKIAALS